MMQPLSSAARLYREACWHRPPCRYSHTSLEIAINTSDGRHTACDATSRPHVRLQELTRQQRDKQQASSRQKPLSTSV